MILCIVMFVVNTVTAKPICEETNNCYYVAPTGDDSNNGSFDSPWATVEKAFTSVEPGDSVYFRGGTYTISSTIDTKYNTNPTADSPVTFTNYQDEKVIINSSVSRAVYINRDYYQVNGFTFSAPGTFWYIADALNATNFKITNCTGYITVQGGSNNLAPVRFQSDRANDGIVENCKFIGPGANLNINTAGVFIFRSQGIKIKNCEFTDIPRAIFYKHTCVGYETGIEFSGNYFYDCGRAIVTVSQYTDIKNNLFVECGIFLNDGGGLGDDGQNNGGDYNTIQHNTFYNSTVELSFTNDGDASGCKYNTIKDNIFMVRAEYHRYSDVPHYSVLDNNLYISGNAVIENGIDYLLSSWQTYLGGCPNNNNDCNSLAGTPTFVGGASLLSIADYELATGSLGKNAASDNTDMGIDINFVGVQEGSSTDITPPAQSKSNNFILQQNHPNPFNTQTTINYQLSVKAHTTLKIYNTLGQEIRTLVNENKSAGSHSVSWDGENNSGKQVSPGIYFYHINIDKNFSETRNMLLIK
ncbi:MAG: T9SS type A sorting domain-containing protein [Bacteroidales bacterium]|nr:T9SS type A sorting domain-containing protein [Bacteroidales bacterium]